MRDCLVLFGSLSFLLCHLSLAVEDEPAKCEGPECDKDFQTKWRLPPRVEGIEVGHEREVELFPGVTTVMKTLSMKPLLFEIPNFITAEECDHLISYAKALGLKRSPLIRDPEEIDDETSQKTFDTWDYNSDGFISPREIAHLPGKTDLYFTQEDILEMFKELEMDSDGSGLIDFEEFKRITVPVMKKYFKKLRRTVPRMRSRNSDQAWMFHDDARYPLLADFHGRLSKLTQLPKELIRQTEPVQAVRYNVHGHYHCHKDSDEIDPKLRCCTMALEQNCRLCRYITVLMFLNEPEKGGDTAFPVADNSTFSEENWSLEATDRCNLAKHCDNSNLRVKPELGKAIMWYNHFRDPKTEWLGELDGMTYHGGCDVTKGTKWVANIWLNIVGEPGTDETFQGWRHLYEKKSGKSGQEKNKEHKQKQKPKRDEAYDVKEEL